MAKSAAPRYRVADLFEKLGMQIQCTTFPYLASGYYFGYSLAVAVLLFVVGLALRPAADAAPSLALYRPGSLVGLCAWSVLFFMAAAALYRFAGGTFYYPPVNQRRRGAGKDADAKPAPADEHWLVDVLLPSVGHCVVSTLTDPRKRTQRLVLFFGVGLLGEMGKWMSSGAVLATVAAAWAAVLVEGEIFHGSLRKRLIPSSPKSNN